MTVSRLHLNIATADYDHVRDIALGRISAEGITLNYQIYPIEETFFRFTQYREWDVSEMSFAKFVSVMSGDAPDIIGLPVFTSRMFRLASIYVNANGPVKSGADLAGKRIGVPEWAQTAAIYTRGWMTDELGIPLSGVTWVQAGLNEPGRREQVKLKLPDGITLVSEPEKSLRDMLRDGEIEAMFSARPPAGVHSTHDMIVPMFLTRAPSKPITSARPVCSRSCTPSPSSAPSMNATRGSRRISTRLFTPRGRPASRGSSTARPRACSCPGSPISPKKPARFLARISSPMASRKTDAPSMFT